MAIKGFGSDPHTWNYDEAKGDNDLPGIALFGNAVQVWAVAQGREVSCNEAALAFNVTPDIIRSAIREHDWMFVAAGDLIGHDGE